eukprot:10755631-Ditylum_brightwellii.AAC.1
MSSTAINVKDGTEVISHSLLSDHGYSASIAHGIRNCLIVSSSSNAGGFESCLQGIDQPLDRQAWAEVVHNMTSYHVHLVEASREAKFSLCSLYKDELRKLMRIAAEGDHMLKDTFCSIGEGPKSNAEKRIHDIGYTADMAEMYIQAHCDHPCRQTAMCRMQIYLAQLMSGR